MEPIIKLINNPPLKSTDNLRAVVEDVAAKANSAIEAGINSPTASNGTSMESLNGAALLTATLKNIGQEIKPDGGMKDGIDALRLKSKAESILKTLDFVESKKPLLP